MAGPALTVGIEEEYLLVDPVTRDLADDPPAQILEDCATTIEPEVGAVTPEFLRAQIEVGTSICSTVAEARQRLARLRGCVAEAASGHGLKAIAASTHPFAVWAAQRHTDKERDRKSTRLNSSH